jgi:hypothetical protein
MSDFFSLTKQWFNFCKSGEKIIRPIHTAFYFYCINICNELHWKKNFGIPTDNTMETLGIKNKKTYYTVLQDLVDFGFIILTEKSINQHTTNIICLPKKRITNVSGNYPSTVPIVRRNDTKTLVNVPASDELKTGLVKIFKTVRPDVPHETLVIEAGKFTAKYPGKDLRKDINLINTWAVKINYEPPKNLQDEFEQTQKRNREKYGN